MSEVSSSGSRRIYRTARSLMPDTPFIITATIVALLLAISASTSWGLPFFFTMFALACSMGLGHMTCLYQKSERRRLVPGMNETCASVAIAISAGLWLLNAAMIVFVYGTFPEAIGGALFVIAFSPWIGWGEGRVFHAFGLLFLVLFAVIATPAGPARIYGFYRELSLDSRNWIGTGIGLSAVPLLWRFGTLATLKIDPVSFKQKDGIISFLMLQQSKSEEVRQDSNERVDMSVRLYTRIRWMVLGKNYSKTIQFWGLTMALMVASVMFAARGKIAATAGFTCFASLMLAVAIPMSFLARVPQSFGRLWITGVSESRADTAAQLLKLTAFRMIPSFMLPFVLLLFQIPFEIEWWLTVLFVLVSGLLLAGVLLWIFARWYVFFSDMRTFAILGGTALAAVAFLILIPFAPTLLPKFHESLGEFGRIPALLMVVSLAAIIWTGCIYDGAKSLGSSVRLMECESNSQPPVPNFGTELY